jgi:hypothetical protein
MKITHITIILQKQKHTLLSTYAAENNNEQQSHQHVHTHKFWQPARENPNLGEPTERDFMSASGRNDKLQQSIMAARDNLQAPNSPPFFFLEIRAKSVLLHGPLH